MNKNVPNIISLLRIALCPVLFVLFFTGCYIASAAFFLVLCLTDSLDGYLARKYNLVSSLGKFLDPIADKVLVVSAMILLAVSIGGEGVDYVLTTYSYAICFTIMIGRDFIVSGFRLVAVEKGIVIAADIFGKIKTFTLDIALTLLFLVCYSNIILYVGLSILYLSTVVAIVGAVNYILKNKSALV